MTFVPGGSGGMRSAGRASDHGPMRIARPPGSSETTAGMRFIGGLPRKLATKIFAGRRYTSSGSPTCTTLPPFMMQMREPMVIASTWSCVT